MVNTFAHIPLGDMCEHSTLWNDHAEHGMHIFNSGFLVAAHGVAIKNAGSCQFPRTALQRLRFTEFNAPVSQEWQERGMKTRTRRQERSEENRRPLSQRQVYSAAEDVPRTIPFPGSKR